MENFKNNINILKLVFKWKIHFFIIVLLSIICAAIFSGSMFITPLFKSNAVVYPANVAPYSDESETEQMLQIFQSRDIKDSIIKKFDLAKHYEIDPNYKYYYTTMLFLYGQNISISKTPYDAVEIEVMDKDPQIACDIANSILDFYNKKIRKLHNTKSLEVIAVYKNQLTSKEKDLDSLKNILYDLGTNYGLYEYESQSEQITKGFLKTITGSNALQINTKGVMKLKENMEKKSGELFAVVQHIEHESENYGAVKLEYEMAQRFHTDKLTYTNVITEPYPADKKAYPIRWLIVVVTAFATFFLSLIVVMIIENYQAYRNSK
ncbi:MAG: hypothetical protein K8R41_07615 [Bacteroidales bacterium]|nr:hypothetical protein [Bacteroidales bacterium]